jgi:hypothetical protein
MARFTASFALNAPDIIGAKASRFTKYLRAVARGNLFKRPNVTPTWRAKFEWQEPMPNVQQLSYDDVEAELNKIRNHCKDSFILLIGGDGLSIHRMNWLIQKYPDLYVDSAPLIIPVQGESPHGVFHIMHAGWRLYWRLINWVAYTVLKRPGHDGRAAKSIKEDPVVSDFNSHYFFLLLMTRALAEYVAELANTGPGVDNPDDIMHESSRNDRLSWIIHFLYDFAFMVIEFKQGVRGNDASTLDRIWREFFASGHCSTANKSLYVPMSIMRAWYSVALTPKLKFLCDKARSIPMSSNQGAMVGWDMPCEMLNAYLTESVQGQVSPEALDKAVKRSQFSNIIVPCSMGRRVRST